MTVGGEYLQTERSTAPSSRALVVGPLLALATGMAIGAAAGTGVGLLALAAASPGDDWASLGAFLVGAVAGLAVSAAAYLAALVMAARRLFPAGRRAAPVLLTLLGEVAVAGYGAMLLAVQRPTSGGWTSLVLLLAVTAGGCGPAAFLGVGTSGRPRRTALAAVAGSALVAGLVVTGSGILAQARTDRVADEMPLVLFDGTTADPAYPGWRRDAFTSLLVRPAHSFTEHGHEGYLKYFAPAGVVFVTMHTDAGDCDAPAPEYTCSALGPTSAGQLRSYARTTPDGSYPRADRFLAVVYPDGSAVSVNVAAGSGPGAIGADQATAVLGALRRVDRARFEDRTGSRLDVP